MAYTKLHSSILTSTVWTETVETKVVWITMLVLADRNGEVQGSVPGLARLAGVTVEACRVAVGKFLAPDPDSRTPDDDGRRIEAIEGGWVLVNHAKYRAIDNGEDRKEKAAERQRRYAKKRREASVSVSERQQASAARQQASAARQQASACVISNARFAKQRQRQRTEAEDNTTTTTTTTPAQPAPAPSPVGGGGDSSGGKDTEPHRLKVLHAAGITGPNAETLAKRFSLAHIQANLASARRGTAGAGAGLFVEYIRANRANYDPDAAQRIVEAAARKADEARKRHEQAEADARASREESAALRDEVAERVAKLSHEQAADLLTVAIGKLSTFERSAINRSPRQDPHSMLASPVLARHALELLKGLK